MYDPTERIASYTVIGLAVLTIYGIYYGISQLIQLLHPP